MRPLPLEAESRQLFGCVRAEAEACERGGVTERVSELFRNTLGWALGTVSKQPLWTPAAHV